MFDEKKLWKDRASRRLKELGVYLRYIFNGHLVIVLLFLLGTGAYYYQNWIAILSNDFPAEIIMALLLGIILTYSPVYNFLLEADQIFLLPLENRLKGYFFRSGIVSLIYQGYVLGLLLAALMPMYAHISTTGFRLFLPYLGVLLAVKAWNLAVNWKLHFFTRHSVLRIDMLVRYAVNTAFLFLLFKQAAWIFLLFFVVIMVFYYLYFAGRTRDMGLKWDALISQEDKRMSSFYRLANLFTDVPKLKDTVKRRKWLDVFLSKIHFSKEKTFLYLLSRTFLRSSDYLGLFVRLTVIGSVALYFVSFGLGQILFAVLFLYLTGFQLLPLWNHHQNKIWVELYPVEKNLKTSAFRVLLMTVLVIQSLIFALIIMIKGEYLISLAVLASGLLFNYLFVFVYSKNRIKE